MMINESFKAVLDGIEKIPSLPHVVAKLLETLEDSNTSAEDVNRIIRMDEALTARVLKIVNSAFYGFPRQISTVTQAVVILGFNAVKSIALSASVIQMFGMEGQKEFNRVAFWENSLSVGVIANMVGRRINYPLPEECLIGGVLHGMGKLVFDLYLHEKFIEALKKARKEKKRLLVTEREVLGIDHCRAGAMLAEKWKLPLQLVEAINYYPEPGLANFNKTLPALVHIGDYVARKKRCGDPGDRIVPRLNEVSKKILNLTQRDIIRIMEDSDRELEKVEDLLEKMLD